MIFKIFVTLLVLFLTTFMGEGLFNYLNGGAFFYSSLTGKFLIVLLVLGFLSFLAYSLYHIWKKN